MMDSLFRDVRFGARILWKDRGFATTAVLTLAICIGANAAIFTIVNSVLLSPLPVPESDQILLVANQYTRTPAWETAATAACPTTTTGFGM